GAWALTAGDRSLWMAGLARVPAGRSNAGVGAVCCGARGGERDRVGWWRPPELSAAARQRGWGVEIGRAGARPGRAGGERRLVRSGTEAVPQPSVGRACGSLPLLSGGGRVRAQRAPITGRGERAIAAFVCRGVQRKASCGVGVLSAQRETLRL